MTREEYGRYLASREWALLRRQVRARSEGQCERCCRAPYQETHHLTYARIGHERLDDLQAVCSPCHRYLSGCSDDDPRAAAIAWALEGLKDCMRIRAEIRRNQEEIDRIAALLAETKPLWLEADATLSAMKDLHALWAERAHLGHWPNDDDYRLMDRLDRRFDALTCAQEALHAAAA